MKFQDRVIQHMSSYKETRLGIAENGKWKKNKQEYPHILPVERFELNLIKSYREGLLQYIKESPVRLHSDFHHLNSSQAACLNFFYPLIEEGLLSALLPVLKIDKEPVVEYQFELKENGAEGTTFDFYMKLKSEKQVLFEIKYKEEGFGKKAQSPVYRDKYENIYKPLIDDKVRDGIPVYPALMENYQLMRNISYINKSRLLVIVCPEGNQKVRKEYEYVINNVLKPEYQPYIKLITWEVLVKEIRSILVSSPQTSRRLLEHYLEFEEKYLF